MCAFRPKIMKLLHGLVLINAFNTIIHGIEQEDKRRHTRLSRNITRGELKGKAWVQASLSAKEVALSKRSSQESINFNNVISNVCHPESRNGELGRRPLRRVPGGSRSRGGGSGSAASRNEIGPASEGNLQEDACAASGVVTDLMGIGAAGLGMMANPAFGVAAGVATGAVSLMFKLTCQTASGASMLMEDIQRMMGDSLMEHETEKIVNDISHISHMMQHDEIMPFSYTTAESYSRELSLLQDRAVRYFNWYALKDYIQIASVHLRMKNYLVPHSFKIGSECGWERLESYYGAKKRVFDDVHILRENVDECFQRWRQSHTSYRCYLPRTNDRAYEQTRDLSRCGREWGNRRWHYEWRLQNGSYRQGFVTNDEMLEDQRNIYDEQFSRTNEIWTSDVIDFRNSLLADNIEDELACGDFGDISLTCSCITGKPYCDMQQQLCVDTRPSHRNTDYECDNFLSLLPETATLLGSISEPGQNYQVSFDLSINLQSESTFLPLLRGSSRASFGSNGTGFGNRNPLIYLRNGVLIAAANDRQDDNWLGFHTPPLELNTRHRITFTYLKNKAMLCRQRCNALMHCHPVSCYSTVAPIHQRPAFDDLYITLGGSTHEDGLRVPLIDLSVTKIMDGYKIIQGERYEATDYKISDEFQSPTEHLSVFAFIPNPTPKFQISFEIKRTAIQAPSGQRAVLYFKSPNGSNSLNYPYFYLIGRTGYQLGAGLSNGNYGGNWITTPELPYNEKVHVKFVDVGGSTIYLYVNGVEYSRTVSSRPSLSDTLEVYQTHEGWGQVGNSDIRIYNLYYSYLTSLDE